MVSRAQRRPLLLPCLVLFAALVATLAIGCRSEAANVPAVTFSTPTPVPPAAPHSEPTIPPSEPTRESSIAQAPPEADAQPVSSALACDARVSLRRELADEIVEAMDGYDGDWGFALIDIQCDSSVAINEDFFEYAASAGKIVTLVAALEAVEGGGLEDWEVESLDLSFRQVLRTSSDWDADLLEGYFDPSRLNELLDEAGVSDRSYMRGSWKFSMMTALDLATFWAAILRGELLDDDSTNYLLDLASEAEIPGEYQTFPGGDFELDGFQYGQKAGFYVEDGVPYHFAGAGFFREIEGDEAFAVTLLIKSETPELLDPQRRTVFPLVVEHILAVTGRG